MAVLFTTLPATQCAPGTLSVLEHWMEWLSWKQWGPRRALQWGGANMGNLSGHRDGDGAWAAWGQGLEREPWVCVHTQPHQPPMPP